MRDEHSAILYGDAMIIYGGFVDIGERTSQIIKYDFKKKEWEIVEQEGEIVPNSRVGHSAVIFEDTMYIFGGRDYDNVRLNDLWAFNFVNQKWM